MSQKDVISAEKPSNQEAQTSDAPELYWDSTYAIAMALIDQLSHVQPENVGLLELTDLIETLDGFADDPALVTDRILLDIQTVWVEELT